MPLGQEEFENQPRTNIPIDQALNAAWAKNGQLLFQIDILMQQLRAMEMENKELKEKLSNKKEKTK